MPGRWQVKVIEALAHESPLRFAVLRARCQARTASERAGVKRAAATLVAQGVVERRAKGVYALVTDVEALLRARFPHRVGDDGGRPCPTICS